MRKTTLCYVVSQDRVLLAMKKRGFGVGKWNGPGGKVEAGETPVSACIREVREEVGIEIQDVQDRGIVEFIFDGKPEWNSECSIFVATQWTGEPMETEEMKPQWFALDAVPLSEMWPDDEIWLDGVLRGGRVNLRFFFSVDGEMQRYESR